MSNFVRFTWFSWLLLVSKLRRKYIARDRSWTTLVIGLKQKNTERHEKIEQFSLEKNLAFRREIKSSSVFLLKSINSFPLECFINTSREFEKLKNFTSSNVEFWPKIKINSEASLKKNMFSQLSIILGPLDSSDLCVKKVTCTAKLKRLNCASLNRSLSGLKQNSELECQVYRLFL